MKKNERKRKLPYEVRIEYVRPIFTDMIQILNSDIANATIRRYIKDQGLDHKEFFWVMLLSRAFSLLGIAHIATGSESGVKVSTAEILQLMLLSHASEIILVHNHPSGRLHFSTSDVIFTREIMKALKPFEFTVNDHLVLTTESYLSMAEEGILEKINIYAE